jgi:predicted HTH transcriptional regulator
MKQTILVCDLCPQGNVPALTTLILTNAHGTKSAHKLDVCPRHHKKIYTFFKQGPVKVQAAAKPKKKWNKINYEPIYPQILKLVDEPGAWDAGKVSRRLKIKYHTVKVAIAKLLQDHKLESHGNGRGRTLTLP